MIETFIHIDSNGTITNSAALRKAFNLKAGKYKVTIKRAGKRSLLQNGYYWAGVLPAVTEGLKDMGHDLSREEVHEWLKGKFNYEEVVNKSTGEFERIPKSTTRLTTLEFSEEYLEKIIQFAAEFLNVIIPPPGKQSEIWDVSYMAEQDNSINATIVKK